MPHLGGSGVTLGWLGAGPASTESGAMTILRHPTAYRAATDEQLVAHELGGASHEVIARRLNVSVGGSKALVCRARSGLGRAPAAA
jgi:hypothetical protein